jgi:LysM repeat protein
LTRFLLVAIVAGVRSRRLSGGLAGGPMAILNAKQPTYTVKPGDTLSAIAATHYGDADAAFELARTNGVANPRLLMPGTLLHLRPLTLPDPVVLNYEVTGMKLIPQTMNMSCWYASAKMLIWWRRHRLRQTTSDTRDPGEDAISEAVKKSDSGLTNGQLVDFARRLGLQLIAPQSPSPRQIDGWLRQYGPLWVNGKSHIVVIAGIRSVAPKHRRIELLVYDPSPVGVGLIQWRSMGGWYAGSAVDSRDVDMSVPAVFMHCPQ